MKKFSEEQINLAKDFSLSYLAECLGYSVIKRGKHQCTKEMDSLMIYDDKTYYRWSRQEGGDTVDFVMNFGGRSFSEAMEFILEKAGANKEKIISTCTVVIEKKEEKKEFTLPEKCKSSYKRMYAYLIQKRGLSTATINYFVENNLLYESADKHNMVFVGYDENRIARYAGMRSTLDINGYSFKGDVSGNDKNYAVNISNKNSDTINVFESVIDMMSYCEYYVDYGETNKMALGMLSDNPLSLFLEKNPNIRNINFYLDRDEPGQKATKTYLEKYQKLGYCVSDKAAELIPEGKDFNEYFIQQKNNVIRAKNNIMRK